MGVLTHLDFFKENKQLRKTKKQLKKRFTYETGEEYKLFYLSGLKTFCTAGSQIRGDMYDDYL